MCQICQRIAKDDPDAGDKLRKELKEAEEMIHRHNGYLTGLEDSYRRAGIDYHTTQLRTRQPPHFNRKPLARLKEAFEISRIEEYEAIFARVTALSRRLADLMSQIAQCYHKGSLEERFHRLHMDILPSFLIMGSERHEVYWQFRFLEDDAQNIHDLSRLLHETRNAGYRTAWQNMCHREPGEILVPAGMQEEWELFRAWVWSLPETQRIVSAGYRMLDDVALDLVFISEGEKQGAEAEELTD